MRDNLYVFFTILYVASFLISAVSYISCHVQKRKWSTTLFKSYSQKMDGMIETIRRAGLDAQIAIVSDAGIFKGGASTFKHKFYNLFLGKYNLFLKYPLKRKDIFYQFYFLSIHYIIW